MKDYSSTVDAVGCEKFWVSVGLESPNDIYHFARVLGCWNMLEGWHSALGQGDGAGRRWMGGTTRVGVLGREKGVRMYATASWAASSSFDVFEERSSSAITIGYHQSVHPYISCITQMSREVTTWSHWLISQSAQHTKITMIKVVRRWSTYQYALCGYSKIYIADYQRNMNCDH
jgi:hypothetical protein